MANYCKANNNNEEVVSQGETWGTPSTYKGDWSYKEYSPCVCSKEYDHLFRQAGEALQFDWRLVAALSKIESGWNSKIMNKDTKAGGLYQFIPKYWSGDAPRGYEDPQYRFDPEISTKAFIHRMTYYKNKFKNAVSSNDQILLCLQSWQAGEIKGIRWPEVTGTYAQTKEGKEYVPKIMEQYKKLGGQIQ